GLSSSSPTGSEPVKLAHLADLHLGFRQYDRQTARGGNQREVDVADAFRRAVDDLVAQRPDLILLAGDIFHSVRPTNPAILFLFRELQRVRVALPETPVVLIAGNHDTPRSVETGTILRLYEALGVEVVIERARRIVFPKLDRSVLAVPHQAPLGQERPALPPGKGLPPGGPAGGPHDLSADARIAAPGRPAADPGGGAQCQGARRPHRAARGRGRSDVRGPGGAAGRVRRVARHGARPGPRRDSSLQVPGAQLPARRAAAGGAPDRRRRRPRAAPHAARHAA